MPRSRNRSARSGRNGEGVSPAPVNGERKYTTAVLAPSSVYEGRVENPDEVLKQFGGWEGLSFYERMLRQFPFLYGICNQSIAATNAIDRSIKPGVPGNSVSEKMAEETRYLYDRIDGKETVNARLLWGKFFGVALAEMVWSKDPATGLRAPVDIFDVNPWLAKFGPNGEMYVLTAKEPYKGEPADPRNFLIYRWGSRQTGYGKGLLQFAYMPTWYIQQLRRQMLQNLERYNKPIPWYRYNQNLDDTQVSAIKSALVAQFKYYVITPSADLRDSLEFPTLNVVSSGAAGRPELEALRHFVGECYIALLGTQQTQDKTGGSRALEETRREISMDQTPPASQALDTVWTKQWSDRIWELNAPTVDRKLWPRFDSDVDSSGVSQGSLLVGAADTIRSYRKKELGSKDIEELLVFAGFPRLKAIEIAQDNPDIEIPEPPAPFGGQRPPLPEEEPNGEEDVDAVA